MVMLIVAAGLVSSGIAPDRARSLEFFSTSAQVIPVLLLVLALEARLLSFPGAVATDEETEVLGRQEAARLTLVTAAGVIVILVALLWAEFAALAALIEGTARAGDVQPVARGLGVGFSAVAVLALSARRA
jgi:hypothetical protein